MDFKAFFINTSIQCYCFSLMPFQKKREQHELPNEVVIIQFQWPDEESLIRLQDHA